MMAPVRERRTEGTPPHGERRDLTTRALRGAVATWFNVHPAKLAALDSDTIDRMALRLEGRRAGRPPDTGDVSRVKPAGHPWAG